MTRIARIHLDPLGGIAGDMFAASMADAFPEHVPGLMAQLAKLGPVERIRFSPHCDAAITGRRFLVESAAKPAPHDHRDSHGHAHEHVPHLAIRARLVAAGLDAEVLRHALALFAMLAEAEGAVHGIPSREVEFHEVGAWDSIVDFVAAAHFIAALAPERWTCAALPLGGGRVSTAHGVLPVPAPATARLLEGLDMIDDGIPGERVTPTGAAIVRYLLSISSPKAAAPAVPVTLAATGNGFGSRRLPGVPNMLRCLAFAASPQVPQLLDEEIAALQFEIDDQTAEDLGVALERIRDAAGVLDASQSAIVGKKGRLATRVQVLARLDAADAVADLCLAQTTTLGVRIARVWRRTVLRASVETSVPETVRVKIAARPSGEMTAKAEIDDLAKIAGERTRREDARRRAETQALRSIEPDGHRERD